MFNRFASFNRRAARGSVQNVLNGLSAKGRISPKLFG
jgi:hypothetical protein